MTLVKRSEKDADFIGGKATVKKFLYSNFVATMVILVTSVGFTIVVFKTRKGAKERLSAYCDCRKHC